MKGGSARHPEGAGLARGSGVLLGCALLAVASLSGWVSGDPRTPPAAPGAPVPFLGTALAGSGPLRLAVDSYGSVVDLRWPGIGGKEQIEHSEGRQRAGTVSPDTGIVVAASARAGQAVGGWTGRPVSQLYREGTGVVRTSLVADGARVRIEDAAHPRRAAFSRSVVATSAARIEMRVNLDLLGDPPGDEAVRTSEGFVQRSGDAVVRCTADPPAGDVRIVRGRDAKLTLGWDASDDRRRIDASLSCAFDGDPPPPAEIVSATARDDRRWLADAKPLGQGAPEWARRLHRRSLLVLRSLTDRSGFHAAGARDFWAYAWPRDAASAALALRLAGRGEEADAIAGFLARVDPERGARFDAGGEPVGDGRPRAGDARGWILAAGGETGSPSAVPGMRWAGRQDYWEDRKGLFLTGALAAGVTGPEVTRLFATPHGLVRQAASPESGLDSGAAWAVYPFRSPELREPVLTTVRSLADGAGSHGIVPGEGWGGDDPWTAPTAWTAMGLAALGDRRRADRLLRALRRAATRGGDLPERVDARTGAARSTTPLGWSHAMAILALRARFPRSNGDRLGW